MGIETVGDWVDVIYKVCMAVFGVWLYLDRRNDKTQDRIAELEKLLDDRIDDHGQRLCRVETWLNKVPTHNDLGDVYREIRKVSESVSVIEARLAALHATLESVKELTSRMDTFWRSTKS
ncbi:MAG: hypothetical protein Q7U98_17170 [Methylicorpusculum sp.]|uniref:hypothetical protein n=1 Tax=Methylicorpusculum sp. TaxID=2713644 RepID=UPI00272480C7|nr:hypothetical protein [Methylicorpusculum sp.]MDO8940888.1 hypothetical protein [Methylicorpusculum sp.]MDP2202421.1 hypothetical protein [Methylicorpusculum sp.]